MSTGIRSFDASINKTKTWLKDLQQELHLDDEEQAYVALRAVLHALRDRLSPDMAAKLGSQLPMVVRGFYYEGWHPAGKPLKIRDQQEFLDLVHKDLTRNAVPKLADPLRITKGVFKVMPTFVTQGEVDTIRQTFPEDMQQLWS
ncbi:MAG: DUF2267 domain-containing protein [Desulfovibrionales bacterium]